MSKPYNIIEHSTAFSFRNEEGVNYICKFSDVTNHYSPILGMYDIKLLDFSFYPETEAKDVDVPTARPSAS